MNFKALRLSLVAASALAPPALAHHSFAMFDAANPLTMTGTVTQFDWRNPHSWLRIAVQDPASGATMEWALELGSPVQQQRVGWSSASVKSGDHITVTVYPAKDGSRAGGLITATLPDGSTLGNGGLRPNAQRSSKFPGGLPAGIFVDGAEQPNAQGN